HKMCEVFVRSTDHEARAAAWCRLRNRRRKRHRNEEKDKHAPPHPRTLGEASCDCNCAVHRRSLDNCRRMRDVACATMLEESDARAAPQLRMLRQGSA